MYRYGRCVIRGLTAMTLRPRRTIYRHQLVEASLAITRARRERFINATRAIEFPRFVYQRLAA